MNATPAVSRAPIKTDPSPAGGATSADSPRSSANSQDFASALSDASPKPARKPATAKAHDGAPVGGPLPVPGNPSPPPAPPASPSAPAASPANATTPSVAAGQAGGIAGTQGGAPGAKGVPGAPAAAPDAPGVAGTGGAFAQALGLPDVAGAEPALPAGDSEEIGAKGVDGALGNGPPAGVAPGAAAASLAATAPAPGAGARDVAAKAAVGLARARGGVGSTAKPLTAATASPAAADGDTTTTTTSDAVATRDATAQISSAAALALAGASAAAANGAGVTDAADTFAQSADESAAPVPATVGLAQDAGNAKGLPVPAPAVAATREIAAAAGTVASAREIAALANAGSADKHSQGSSGGSLLADGSGNAIAGAALMNAAVPAAMDVNPAQTLKVAAGVETPEFAQGIADRVSWMVDSNLNGAKLQVNPPQLGPIEVRISVQGDNAQIWLTSHSAVTRDALEASSPKLREMLGAQGFGQVSVDISQRSFQERPPQAQPYDWAPSANRAAAAAPVPATAATIRRISNGALDAYA